MLAKYACDTLGRLTQTQDGATGTPIETYAYDATGNRASLTTSAGTASYTYPATSHRLAAVDGEARNHDAAGNTTSIGSKAFTYNDANRMNAVKQGDAVLESYGYNHRGERVLRTPAGGAAQITLYDEAGQWLGNYSATGQAQQQAIWLDNYPVALINVPGTGVPELAYVQPDHLGTPRVVIDPVRDVAIWEWSNKSEVFGNQIPSADLDGDGVAFELALRFPGQQATDASGLFYNYQREYDPAAGRYSQSDPMGFDGGVSTFSYVSADPVQAVDPLGLLANCTCVDGGVHIDIPIRFSAEGATPETLSKMINAIESTWSAPGFTVTVSQPEKGRLNRVEVPLGRGGVTGGSVGKWYAGNTEWTAAHEAGHLMKFKYDGRFDMYDVVSQAPSRSTKPVPGWEGNIMAEHLGVPDDRVRDAIKKRLGCK